MPDKKETPEFLSDVKVNSYVGHKDDVTCCAFSTDWTLLATGADDLTLRLWNMKSNKLVYTMTGHGKSLKCICFSEDNEKIASGGHDSYTMVWSTATGKQLNKLSGHLLAVESVAFSRSGFLLCSCSWDNTAILWDLLSSSPIRILNDHCSVVQCCAFSINGDMLATAAWDYKINIYNIKEKQDDALRTLLEFKEKYKENNNLDVALNHHHTSPQKKFCSQNKRPSTALLSSQNVRSNPKRPSTSHSLHRETVKALDMRELTGHKSNIKALTFSIHNILASASWDCTVILWEPNSGTKLHHLKGHEGFVQACAFSFDGAYLASAADDNTVKIWCVENGILLKTLDAFTEEIHQLSFTNTGTLLATGPEKLSLQLY